MKRRIRSDLKPKLWRLAEAFEGSSNGAAAGNFDGQLLSWGALQWNVGQGTLLPLLRDIVDRSADAAELLGADLVAALDSQASLADFVRREVLGEKGGVKLGWQGKLQALYKLPISQDAMIKAAEPYYRRAVTYAISFGLHTERALALCWDLSIQNGSVDHNDFRHYIDEMSDHEDIFEWQRLKGLGVAMAKGSNPRWHDDVRARKVAIAVGQGIVHGRKYVLADDFGIRYYAEQEQRLLALWYE